MDHGTKPAPAPLQEEVKKERSSMARTANYIQRKYSFVKLTPSVFLQHQGMETTKMKLGKETEEDKHQRENMEHKVGSNTKPKLPRPLDTRVDKLPNKPNPTITI